MLLPPTHKGTAKEPGKCLDEMASHSKYVTQNPL